MRSKYAARVRSQPSPLQGHRTPYCPWVVWNLGGRARPRNSFARFPPCFKNTSRGAIRFRSKKQFPKKRQRGSEPPHRRMAQGRKDYPTQARARKWVIRDARRMCAYMENTVYAIRCVCLWIMVGGGHTAFGQFRSKSNKRPWRVPTHLMKRERKSSTNQPRTE